MKFTTFFAASRFINRTFAALIHQSLAQPVSPQTSHATLMGFESPAAMSRMLTSVTPDRNGRTGSISPDKTPKSGRFAFVGSTRRGSASPQGPLPRGNDALASLGLAQRAGSSSPVHMLGVGPQSPLAMRSSNSSASISSLTIRKAGSGRPGPAKEGS
jgi:hypothetical protein